MHELTIEIENLGKFSGKALGCPFCGSIPGVYHMYDQCGLPEHYHFSIYCSKNDCPANELYLEERNFDNALKIWNTRVYSQHTITKDLS